MIGTILIITVGLLVFVAMLGRKLGMNWSEHENNKPTEVNELNQWAIGLPVKFVGGEYYKKTGRIVKLISDYDWHIGLDFSKIYIEINNPSPNTVKVILWATTKNVVLN
jgi:hypothetical protein